MASGFSVGFSLNETIKTLHQKGKKVLLYLEEANVKDGLRVGQVVLLQLTEKARVWRSKVGNARRRGDARPHHEDDLPTFATLDVVCHRLDGRLR